MPVRLAGKRVLILAAPDFEDMELLYPLYRLREEGATVVVAGIGDDPYRGKKGYFPLKPDAHVDQVSSREFDALVIPGGYAPDKLRRVDKVLELVREMNDEAKPIGFICHAAWVPISAQIVKGRRITCVPAIRDDVINAGADYVDEPVVVDGNLITSRVPDDLAKWLPALIDAIEQA
jgi:deglycase